MKKSLVKNQKCQQLRKKLVKLRLKRSKQNSSITVIVPRKLWTNGRPLERLPKVPEVEVREAKSYKLKCSDKDSRQQKILIKAGRANCSKLVEKFHLRMPRRHLLRQSKKLKLQLRRLNQPQSRRLRRHMVETGGDIVVIMVCIVV